MTMADGPFIINWGDGTTEVLDGSLTTARTHAYATAGTYRIRVRRPERIAQIHLLSSALGGFNTAQLRNSPIVGFYLASITGSTFNSADMRGWPVTTDWQIRNMPAGGIYRIDTSDMAHFRPTRFWFYAIAGGDFVLNSAQITAWRPNDVRIAGALPAGTYTINSVHLQDWPITTAFYLNSVPAGTYVFDFGDVTTWAVSFFYLHTMPAGTYTINPATFAAWTGIRDLRVYTLDPIIPTATVDAIIDAIHAARNGYTVATNIRLDIGGTNGGPTGVVQNVCPPTTPGERLWNLHHVQCAGDTHRVWSPITYTGGTLP